MKFPSKNVLIWLGITLYSLNGSAQSGSLVPDSVVAQDESSPAEKKIKFELSGYIGVEGAKFYNSTIVKGQSREFASTVAFPTLKVNYKNNHRVILSPFARWDGLDKERSHIDMREAYYSGTFKSIELNAGIQQVSWGNMIGPSVVNVINQSDEREDFLRSERLGQAQANLAYIRENFSATLFVIPFFRKKNFPDAQSPLFYFPVPIAENNVRVDHKSSPSIAARITKRIESLDVAVSHFYGTNRMPNFALDYHTMTLNPHYKVQHQSNVELQHVFKNITSKLELANKWEDKSSYQCINAGLEYVVSNIFGSGIENTFYGEYLYDQWRKEKQFPFADAYFLGSKLNFSDVQSSEVFIKFLSNREEFTPFINVECSRRVTSNGKIILSITEYLGKELPYTSSLSVMQYNSNVSLTLRRFF